MREASVMSDRSSGSARALSTGILCEGCGRQFIPSRHDQRCCRRACRAAASRNRREQRLADVLERLDPVDPGRPE